MTTPNSNPSPSSATYIFDWLSEIASDIHLHHLDNYAVSYGVLERELRAATTDDRAWDAWLAAHVPSWDIPRVDQARAQFLGRIPQPINVILPEARVHRTTDHGIAVGRAVVAIHIGGAR
jgi:hypothetical protein